MHAEKLILRSLAAILALIAVSSTAISITLYNRLNEREKCALSARKTEKVSSADIVDAEVSTATEVEKKEREYREMRILDVIYHGYDYIKVVLSEPPDMRAVTHYVEVEPRPDKELTICQGATWHYESRKTMPTLEIVGEFKYSTNCVLRLRKGLPINCSASWSTNSNFEAINLCDDFTYTFRRHNDPSSVDFVDSGRYLPPIGNRQVALSSLNIDSVVTEVRRIPSANIVHFLALDYNAYKHAMKWNSYFADDLCEASGWMLTNQMTNASNTSERFAISLTSPESVASNGVFVISAEGRDRSQKTLDCAVKVVCISDIGLSARTAGDGLGVWAVSLTSGHPLGGATVTAYSSANVLLARGKTDVNGWCRLFYQGKDEPFAVVAESADGADATFIALRDPVKEQRASLDASPYLADDEYEAYVWSDRGIYRHGEKIFFQGIIRNGAGVAPHPFPVVAQLIDPRERVHAQNTLFPNAAGIVGDDSFYVDAEQPSGEWILKLKTPGENGKAIGQRTIKIEEFAPPQIRVKVNPSNNTHVLDFGFAVSAEHLYGGPAKKLGVEATAVFTDCPFKPEGWNGFTFGSCERALKPNTFKIMPRQRLDESGAAEFVCPLPGNCGKPRAAVMVTAQGTVFEDGGRPATSRQSVLRHYYPYYIGSNIGNTVRLAGGSFPVIELAAVDSDGKRVGESKKLSVKISRIDSVYNYRRDHRGWATWQCQRVQIPVVEDLFVETSTNANTAIALPLEKSGDYLLSVYDPVADVAFAREFYLGAGGDDAVRAPLDNPSAVTLVPDRTFYRPGETPRIAVRSPFAGQALLTVSRDKLRYSRVLKLEKATCEIALDEVAEADAPNLKVQLSVVQSVTGGARRMAVRAHGECAVSVRPVEREIPVEISSTIKPIRAGGSEMKLIVDFIAPGATVAAVTVVDEGINLFTDERLPDPAGYFARSRDCRDNKLFDLYRMLLPVVGNDELKLAGVKTGGDSAAELLSRISPVPTRRFKPLSRYVANLPVADGKGSVEFDLPDFQGELRITVVACSPQASGSAKLHRKVAPKLAMHGDAPRFVAPGDEFEAVLSIANLSGRDGEAEWKIEVDLPEHSNHPANTFEGKAVLAAGETKVIRKMVKAPDVSGQMRLRYQSQGFGEKREQIVNMPVRPSVPWRETAGVVALGPEEQWQGMPTSQFCRVSCTIKETPLAELQSALRYLANYPHGCLEQTVSRIFPLVAADGILVSESPIPVNELAGCINAGIRRVSSMVRKNNFVMWPDTDYEPWDREVSLYAAHFLVEAANCGKEVPAAAKSSVSRLLKKWSLEDDDGVSAYACHTLALAGTPERSRMFRLYDRRAHLSLLDRARLARAFARIGDGNRAETLLAGACAPASIKEAAFQVLALLDLHQYDKRLPALITYLLDHRDKARLSWGTTAENAHALLAIGAYYRVNPVVAGKERFAVWQKLELADVSTVKDESSDLSVRRRFFSPSGRELRDGEIKRGDLLIVEIAVKCAQERDLADLIIEDPFAGAFEPVHSSVDAALFAGFHNDEHSWVLRFDARDDKMLVYSKKFHIAKDGEVRFYYPLRAVSCGNFALPQVAVEAMYQPGLAARAGAGRIVLRD